MREIATFAYLMLTSSGTPNIPTGACTVLIYYVSIYRLSTDSIVILGGKGICRDYHDAIKDQEGSRMKVLSW